MLPCLNRSNTKVTGRSRANQIELGTSRSGVALQPLDTATVPLCRVPELEANIRNSIKMTLLKRGLPFLLRGSRAFSTASEKVCASALCLLGDLISHDQVSDHGVPSLRTPHLFLLRDQAAPFSFTPPGRNHLFVPGTLETQSCHFLFCMTGSYNPGVSGAAQRSFNPALPRVCA